MCLTVIWGEKNTFQKKKKIQMKINVIFLSPPVRPGRLRAALGFIFRKIYRVCEVLGMPIQIVVFLGTGEGIKGLCGADAEAQICEYIQNICLRVDEAVGIFSKLCA